MISKDYKVRTEIQKPKNDGYHRIFRDKKKSTCLYLNVTVYGAIIIILTVLTLGIITGFTIGFIAGYHF